MLSRRCSLSALFLVLSTAALPQQESVTSAVEAYMREHGVTGATVAIGQNGKMVYERAFGMADIEHDVRATTSTVYRLASISKSITAVAVMQLVEAGKVKLDEDARTYVPEFPQKENRFTVRDILCHQSGIRHYKQNEPPGVKRYTSVADSLEVFSGDPLLHEPGTKYGYSTHAYTILARLVEIASGMSFREYLKSQLFKRAGMETTDIEDQQTIVKHRSRGYRKGSDGLLNSPFEDISYKQ
ncbi:MAG TPA: serine hydrolase domain-containing protein, partial [Fimbriimonadaceae bacterium]|nr:serine hydrolase domain-containing protein [Fimbriimonadaceae bacterium]